MEIVRALICVAVVVIVAGKVRSAWQRAAEARAVRREFRRWMWIAAPALIVIVVSSAVALMQVPGLDWGWARLLGMKSNVILAPVQAAEDSKSVGLVAVLVAAATLAFLVALGWAMPLLALSEEREFRYGLEHGGWRRWGRATLRFGLVHVIAGIPIGAALALSWGGLAFGLVYRRAWRRFSADERLAGSAPGALAEAACRVSAAFHTIYNLWIVGIVAATAAALAT